MATIDKSKDINVGGTLHSIITGNILAHADEIMDEAWGESGEKLSVINLKLKETASSNLESLTNLLEEEKTRLNSEIAARKAVDGQDGQTYTANDSTNYINNATSLNDADIKLDSALKNLSDTVTANKITAADKSVVVTPDSTGTTIKVNIKSDELVLKLDTTNGLYTNIRVNKVKTPSGENVREEYELLATDGSRLGETIKVYKDSSLLSIKLLHATDSSKPTYDKSSESWTDINEQTEANLALCYAYEGVNGSVIIEAIPVGDFLREAEFKDGLEVKSNGEVYVKKDQASEDFLSVSTDGIKVSGVQAAIDAATGDEKKRAEEAEADLAELVYYYHATCTLAASPTLIEKGVNTTINLTAKSSIKTDGANSLTIKNNSSSTNLTTSGTTASMTATDTINDTTTFTATAAFDHNVSKTATVIVTAKYPCYSFGSTSTTVSSANIIAGTKAVKSSAAGNYAFTLAQNFTYFWICIPSEMSVNKVTLSGFDVPMLTPITVAVDGKGNYKCYRSTNSNDAGSYTLVVS